MAILAKEKEGGGGGGEVKQEGVGVRGEQSERMKALQKGREGWGRGIRWEELKA